MCIEASLLRHKSRIALLNQKGSIKTDQMIDSGEHDVYTIKKNYYTNYAEGKNTDYLDL